MNYLYSVLNCAFMYYTSQPCTSRSRKVGWSRQVPLERKVYFRGHVYVDIRRFVLPQYVTGYWKIYGFKVISSAAMDEQLHWEWTTLITCMKSMHAPSPRTTSRNTATGDGISQTFKTGRACTKNGESTSPYEYRQVHEFSGLFLKAVERLATVGEFIFLPSG